MAQKKNPLNLNPLQLRTLALLQELASLADHAVAKAEDGSVTVMNIPHAHGDHFHMGSAVVARKDATGLTNQAAWVVLERRGLLRSMFPHGATLTAEGLAYETGVREQILHRSDH